MSKSKMFFILFLLSFVPSIALAQQVHDGNKIDTDAEATDDTDTVWHHDSSENAVMEKAASSAKAEVENPTKMERDIVKKAEAPNRKIDKP